MSGIVCILFMLMLSWKASIQLLLSYVYVFTQSLYDRDVAK